MAIVPGLMTYSYHVSYPEGAISEEQIVESAAEQDLRSLEWCHFSCHEPGKVDWDQVRLLDRIGRDNGIQNSVAGFGPLLARGKAQIHLLDMVRTQIEVSQFIGSSRLRFGGMVELALGIGTQAPLDVCLENLGRVVELGQESGIVIALENHMDFRTEDFRFFLQQIDSPFLGVNLDTGNQVPLFEDTVTFASEFADRIVSCHLKGVRFTWEDYGAVLSSCSPADSVVDLTAILDILERSNDDIPVHIEVVTKSSDDERRLVDEYAGFLRDYLALRTPERDRDTEH